MLIQSIHYSFAAEDGDRAACALEELRDASRREPGILSFEVARSRESPGVFALWEEYRDEEALASHVASEHFQRLVVHGLRQFAKERRAEVGYSLGGARQGAAVELGQRP